MQALNKINPKSIVHIITHTDLDGYSAAMIMVDYLIIEKKLPKNNITISHCNYDRAPTFKPLCDVVIVLDYSLSNKETIETMRYLNENKTLIWIDHHQTSMDKIKEMPEFEKINGIRSPSYCATYLTWQYLYPNKEVPQFVTLVDDYDCHKKQFWTSECLNMAFKYNIDFIKNEFSDEFRSLLTNEFRLQHEIMVGNDIQRNLRGMYYNQMKAHGFLVLYNEIPIVSDHSFPCINSTDRTRDALFMEDERFHIGAVYNHDGKKFTFTIYTDKDGPFDGVARQIAEKFGGGGHPNAAGFVTDKFPFTYVCKLSDYGI